VDIWSIHGQHPQSEDLHGNEEAADRHSYLGGPLLPAVVIDHLPDDDEGQEHGVVGKPD